MKPTLTLPLFTINITYYIHCQNLITTKEHRKTIENYSTYSVYVVI